MRACISCFHQRLKIFLIKLAYFSKLNQLFKLTLERKITVYAQRR